MQDFKQIASPFSTGGGGGNFERQIGAYYLASLLLGSIPRGLNIGVTREIKFQRLYESEPLDDLIILAETQKANAKLALQIKRDLVFGEKDAVFDDVIAACWKTFSAEQFKRNIDRFGICLGLYSKQIDEHYQTVLSWARNSASAEDFFNRNSTKRLASETQRSFVKLIRNKIDNYLGAKVSNEDLWDFFKSFVILRFDFENEGSADYTHTLELLKSVVQEHNDKNSSSLFKTLSNYAGGLNQTAGSIDANSLRQKLTSDAGFTLNTIFEYVDDIEQLNEHGTLILNNIKTDINGLELNRISIIEETSKLLAESDCLEIIGSPGVGKSVILKLLSQNQQGQGGTLILAGDRVEGNGWNSFARDIGLSNRLQDLLSVIGSNLQPTIFIDNPDRLTDTGSRQVIKDLLHHLQKMQTAHEGLKKWKVVVSVREENLRDFHSWFDWRKLGVLKTFSVPQLSDEEVILIGESFPRIKQLLFAENLRSILRTPLMLDLLLDERVLLAEDTKLLPIATEVEVQNVWWSRIVGSESNDGSTGTVAGRRRQIELLKIGDLAIKYPGKPIILNNFTADILLFLEKDRILIRDRNREVHRFGHDLLEDWIFSRVLSQHQNSLASFLLDLGQPFGLIRPMQLLGCATLESSEPAENWRLLLEQIERNDNLSPRWRQALYSSPLISIRAFDLLDKIGDVLLEDDGRLLHELLIVLRTIEVSPDLSLFPYINESTQQNLIPTILYASPIPRWQAWTPFMKWLISRAEEIPKSLRDEVTKVFEIWQQRTPTKFTFRREIGEIAFSWLEDIERWYDRDE